MKKLKGKKLLSLIMAVVMVIGLLPVEAFASGSDQIVKQGETQTTEDGSVKHSKIIEATGEENEFDITLTVKTKEEIKQQTASADAAVVLVMDVSNSMKETVNGEEPDDESEMRITQAKAAAKKFIDSFGANAEGAERKVSIVEFGSSAYTVQGWTDIATAKNAVDNVSINYQYPACSIEGTHTHEVNYIAWEWLVFWKCTYPGCEYGNRPHLFFNSDYEGHTHEQTFDGHHGDIMTDGGGTNIEGGLQLADNLLDSSAVSEIDNRYVVLITDGVPTYHVYQGRNNSSTTFIEGQRGGGDYAAPSDYQNVPAVANAIKEDATLYTVSYASELVEDKVDGKSIDAWLTSFANKNIVAESNIDWGLGQVTEIIQNQAKAWILTDPIPAPYITFDFEKNSGIANAQENPNNVLKYDPTDGVLTWNLRNDTYDRREQEGNVIWYIYETKYHIGLDTAAEGFEEGKAYATNGTTTLTYMLTENGVLQSELKSTELVVPAVQGEIPEYSYSVEYYKQETATAGDYDNYTKVTVDTENGPLTDLHTSVTILDKDGKIPERIQNKYTGDNYHLAKAEATIKITDNPANNVIKVYYDRDTTSVTVNHYYKIITIDENGLSNEETVKYGEPTTEIYNNLYVSDPFTAPLRDVVDGQKYTLVEDKSDEQTITSLGCTNDSIDLYYVCTVDRRAKADILEQYVLIDQSWQLNDQGKYELVTTQSKPNEFYDSKDDENADWRQHSPYTGHVDNLAISEDYKLVKVEATNGIVENTTAKTILKEGENIMTLYYEKEAVDTRIPTTVTIHHLYTMDRTYIEGGEVKHEKYTDEEGATDEVKDVYVDETFTVSDSDLQVDYKGFTFEPDPANTMTIEKLKADGNDIYLYYSYTAQMPESASISVTHEYYDATTKYNEETGEVYVDYTLNEGMTKTVQYPLEGDAVYRELYVGQRFEAPLQPEEGYEFKADKSDPKVVEPLKATNAPITLCYYAEDEMEGRQEASIQVRHSYYTNETTAVVDGLGTTTISKPDATTIVQDVAKDNYSGYQGDTFTPTAALEYNENTYELTAGSTKQVTLTAAGDNGTIYLVYERDTENLTSATVTVTHHYMMRSMFIDENGKAQWGEYLQVAESDDFTINDGQQLPAALYVGNGFTVDKATTLTCDINGDGTVETVEFQAGTSNNWTVKVTGETQHVDYYYYYDQALPTATVRVRHEYTENKFLYSNGVEVTETTVTYTPGENQWTEEVYYVGETATVDLTPLDYTFDTAKGGVLTEDGKQVTLEVVSGNNDVVLQYSKETDRRTSTSVTVTHVYVDRDYNGSTKEVDRSSNTVSYFAGLPFTVSYNTKNGLYPKDQMDVSASGAYRETLMRDAVTLENVSGLGENFITITYIRDVDTREATQVQVTYNYYSRDTYTDDDDMLDVDYIADKQPDYTVVQIISDKDAGVWVGNSYTAEQRPDYTVGTGEEAVTLNHRFVNAVPSDTINPVAALENGTVPDRNKITLNYIRDYTTDPGDTTYTVIHEYYTNNGFTGRTTTTGTGKIGDVVNAADIDKLTTFEGNAYNFTSASPDSITLAAAEGAVTLAADGNTFTFRYDRSTGGGGGGPVTPDPDPDPGEEIEIPDPETPLDPGPGEEVEIPDPETPLDPGPGEEVEIPEEETPLAPAPEETTIDDGEVPLASLPQTGAAMATISPAVTAGMLTLAAAMIAGGVVYTIGRKKEDDLQ